jgi:hypothetical protein
MSHSPIRTRDFDDDYDDNKVKYLTPRKYRVQQRTKLPNVHDDLGLNKNDHVLTPTKYRQKKDEESQQDNTNLLYKKYPVVIGDFILTKKSTEHNSIYNYQPKHTQIPPPYVYKCTITSSDVQERAKNEMKQFVQQRSRTSSSSPVYKKATSKSKNIDYRDQLFIRYKVHQSKYTQSSSSSDDSIVDNPRNPTYESLRRQSQSFTALCRSPQSSTVYENKQRKYSSNTDKYCFGVGSENDEENFSSDGGEEYCVAFCRETQPKSIIHQPIAIIQQPRQITEQLTTVVQQSTSIPSLDYHNHEFDNNIFQEVVDVGTSTDDILPDQEQFDDDQPTSTQNRYLTNQQSVISNQSSRSETETYRVNKQNGNEGNYEEPDTVPFPTVKYPASVSTSNPSISGTYINQPEPNNYEIDTTTNKTSKKDNHYVGDTDSQRSTSEPPSGIQLLTKNNPLVGLPQHEYENVNNPRQPEPSLSNTSLNTNSSRRSILDVFRRGKKDDKPTKKDKSNKKKDEKKKRKA